MRRFILALMLVLSATIAHANPIATLEQATQFLQSGDYAQAKTAYESVIASNPAPEVALSARVNMALCEYYLPAAG